MSLQPATPEAFQLLMEGSVCMARIEAAGIRIDTAYLTNAIKEVKTRITDLEKSLRESEEWRAWAKHYGDNMKLGSKQQLGHVIFNVMGHERNPFMEKSNDVAAFEHLQSQFVKDYQDIARLKNALTRNLYNIQRETVDSFLHPFFDLYTAESYRSSSSRTNLQNQPIRNKDIARIVRSCMIPRKDHVFLEVDYSVQEVKVSYCYNKDPKLKHDILHGDMHRDRTKEIFMLTDEEMGPNSCDPGKIARYCNPPDAPIWMADFSFKPLGEIKVGDEVVGWMRPERGIPKRGSQSYKGNKGNRKRIVPALVTEVHRHVAPTVVVTMESGRVFRCTADHLWVDYRLTKCGQGERYTHPNANEVLAHVIDVPAKLSSEQTRKALWLGGLYDGEGSCGVSITNTQSHSHNPKVCEAIEKTLGFLRIPYGVGRSNSTCNYYSLKGGMQTAVSFLDWCEPIRRSRIANSIRARSSFFKPDRIVSVQQHTTEEVIGLTTTTGNYVAWGYASKNCGKNKFVFAEFYGSYFQQRAPELWDSISIFDLKTTAGVSYFDHLKSKGIKKLGACDPELEPKEGTFEKHVQEVERSMWEDSYPVYAQWKQDWWNLYQSQGGINTLTGFVQAGVFRRNQILCDAIQGSAFHCLLWSMIRQQKEMIRKKMRSRIVAQIHDSELFDCHKNELDDVIEMVQRISVRDVAQAWKWIIVPLSVEFELAETNWYDKHQLEVQAA